MHVLEDIGLSKAEAAVYRALLGLGSSPSMKIVQETGLRKSTIYDSLRRLQDKGLVSSVFRESLTYFEAANPERLLDFVAEKRLELKARESKIRKMMPSLKKDFDSPKPHAEAYVLVGVEGFKTMRRDVLRNARGEHLLIGAVSEEDRVMPSFFSHWNRQRQKKRISVRILHKEEARQRAMAGRKFMGKYFETRFLPEEIRNPTVVNIYGDRVVNVLWKNKHPICFLLINKEIADSYRQYFYYLWNNVAVK